MGCGGWCLRRLFQPLVFAYGPAQALRNLGECLWWLSASFMGVGVALGLVGVWRQLVTAPRELLLLGGILLPQLVFFANYDAADREFMLLPVYVVWAVWVAIGASFIADLVRSYGLGIGASVATSAALLALPLLALSVNYPLVDLSSERRPRQEAEALFAAAGPDAVVVGRWTEISPMLYLQKVEGQRPDIALLYSSSQDEQYLWDIVRTYAARRPVYIPEEQGVPQSQYELLPVGQWFQVKPKSVK